MRLCIFIIWTVLSLTGCLVPSTQDSRGVNSPMMNAFQSGLPQEKPSPFSLPLSPQSQAYALTGGVLVLMILVILRSSQYKEK